MKASDIMTGNPACCTPGDTVERAAQLMAENDCGCIPVVDDLQARHVVGVVTDRDLTTRALAQGRGPDTPVEQVMSDSPSCCTPDTNLDEVARIMAERQVRRVPVVDSEGCCVGMVAQADLAREDHPASDREVGRVVERISEPSGDARAETDVGVQPGRSGGCC